MDKCENRHCSASTEQKFCLECRNFLIDEGILPHYEQVKVLKAETKPHDILAEMAQTFKERNAVYGDNYKMVADLMCTLHPNGFNQLSNQDHELGHLWSLLIVKLSRFAISGLTHKDSIHDLAVYAAMIEAILTNREKNAS